jgi:hypothetical protein
VCLRGFGVDRREGKALGVADNEKGHVEPIAVEMPDGMEVKDEG